MVMGLFTLAACAAPPAAPPPDSGPRIGVYDSRAIAIAFVGSEVYNATDGKRLVEMKAAHDRAKAAGDHERMAELEAWGKARQALLHRQSFSTAPVDDILTHIADQLPQIKRQAGVARIVSKWNAETLQKYQSEHRVDVTMRLVEAFRPIVRQKKSAMDIQRHEPVPLEKMKDHNP